MCVCVCVCVASVDIREIKEVREGIGSKDFERQPEELRKLDQFCCFVIYYGSEFKLKTLSVAGQSIAHPPYIIYYCHTSYCACCSNTGHTLLCML